MLKYFLKGRGVMDLYEFLKTIYYLEIPDKGIRYINTQKLQLCKPTMENNTYSLSCDNRLNLLKGKEVSQYAKNQKI